jgi:hypothetical protein
MTPAARRVQRGLKSPGVVGDAVTLRAESGYDETFSGVTIRAGASLCEILAWAP